MSITDCGLMYKQFWCHPGPNPRHDSAWGNWLTGRDSPKLFGLRRGAPWQPEKWGFVIQLDCARRVFHLKGTLVTTCSTTKRRESCVPRHE
jgi:hypothetical protein